MTRRSQFETRSEIYQKDENKDMRIQSPSDFLLRGRMEMHVFVSDCLGVSVELHAYFRDANTLTTV